MLIAILTDFGLKDGFVGTMKGVIYGINQDARIVDISHDISPQNILEGAFILETSFRYFPEGTIFLTVVDPGVGSDRKALILKTEKYFFIGPDNGIFSFIYKKEKPLEIVEITNRDYFLPEVSQTFHGRDIFAPLAAHLSKGMDFYLAGKKIDTITLLPGLVPEIRNSTVMGHIMYIDKFGNLITNITEDFISKKYIMIKFKDTKITRLSKSYSDSSPGEVLAVIGSSGYLEIAVNQGNAKEIFHCNMGEKIFLIGR